VKFRELLNANLMDRYEFNSEEVIAALELGASLITLTKKY